jgi:hypothetical protein
VRKISILSVMIVCISSVPLLFGQLSITPNDQLGTTAYQSYSGSSLESVNLATGTLSVHIPLLSYPQRGSLKLNFELLSTGAPVLTEYTQTVGKQENMLLPTYSVPNATIPPGVGTNTATPPYGVYPAYADAATVGTLSPVLETFGSYKNYVSVSAVFEPNGAEHILGNLGTNSVQASNYAYVTYSGPFESVDATGWNYSTNAAGNALLLTRSDGVTFNLAAPRYEQDPNGNTIQFGASGYTDTIGRFVPYPPEPGASGNTSTGNCSGPLPVTAAVLWSPPGQGNSTLSYVFCYASVQVEYPSDSNIAGTGIVQPVTMLQSVVLPNNTTWTFQYNDSDPGDPAGTNYGNLTAITLPTGGSITYTYANASGPGGLGQIRVVSSRTINDSTGSHTWTYTRGSIPNGSSSYLGVSVVDPLNNCVMHGFQLQNGFGSSLYETLTNYYDSSSSGSCSGNLLKTVSTVYNSNAGLNTNALTNVVPTSITTTYASGNTSSVAIHTTLGLLIRTRFRSQTARGQGSTGRESQRPSMPTVAVRPAHLYNRRQRSINFSSRLHISTQIFSISHQSLQSRTVH